MSRGLSARASARASSRSPPAWRRATTTNCIISSVTACGIRPRSRPNSSPKPISFLVGRRPCWSSTTRRCRRRAATRSAWPTNTPACWARRPIARFWSRSRWRATRCRFRSPCASSSESWTSEPARLQRAGVPEAFGEPRSKPEIALSELDRALQAGVRFGAVVADASYGISAAFRQALSARGLVWAVGIPRTLKVYPDDVELIWPAPKHRGRRASPEPDGPSTAAEALLAGARWRTLGWRRGCKGPLKAAFAAIRVRVADGPAARLHGRDKQRLPDAEVWLVGERRASGKRKYYLSNLPPDTALKQLASLIKARWVCDQAHQQLKEELGLDHFEGRSWKGLHRHALMALLAFCFLQEQRLSAARRGKKEGSAASAEPSGDPSRAARSAGPSRAPVLSALPRPLQPAALF